MQSIKKPKVAIVAPCHIPPLPEWIDALERERKATGATIIIVDDSNGKLGLLPEDWKVYDYLSQEIFLGALYPEFAKIFHKSSACRIFGHIWAYVNNFDIVIGLDSDCIVHKEFVESHTHTLGKNLGGGWQNPIQGSGFYPRGFPYHLRDWKVIANMGLWDKTLDLNGADRSPHEPTECQPTEGIAVAPIPFSGMNFSIAREAIPGFLFFPNFNCKNRDSRSHIIEHQFRRIDDIWGGYVFQKMSKLLKHSITYGWPIVDHVSDVIPAEDAAEEAGMYAFEERFYDLIDVIFGDIWMENFTFSKDEKGYLALYNRVLQAFHFNEPSIAYAPFTNLTSAFQWWIKVWEKYGKA